MKEYDSKIDQTTTTPVWCVNHSNETTTLRSRFFEIIFRDDLYDEEFARKIIRNVVAGMSFGKLFVFKSGNEIVYRSEGLQGNHTYRSLEEIGKAMTEALLHLCVNIHSRHQYTDDIERLYPRYGKRNMEITLMLAYPEYNFICFALDGEAWVRGISEDRSHVFIKHIDNVTL